MQVKITYASHLKGTLKRPKEDSSALYIVMLHENIPDTFRSIARLMHQFEQSRYHLAPVQIGQCLYQTFVFGTGDTISPYDDGACRKGAQ